MGKKFAKKENWTFGLEIELKCKVKSGYSDNFLIVKKQGEDIIRVMGDMGDAKERTVEIVTEPIRIKDEEQHRKNMQIIIFLKDLFTEICQRGNHTMGKEEIVNRFKENFADEYSIGVLYPELTMYAYDYVGIGTEQITFGMPARKEDVDTFLKEMRIPWYDEKLKYKSEGLQDEEEWKYNYILSVMDFYIHNFIIATENTIDLCSPRVKNKWGAMPRNSVKELCDKKLMEYLSLEKVQKIFEGKYEKKDIEACYEYLMNDGVVGGHTKSIKDMGEKQLLFECREVPGDLREFYFDYSSVTNG